MVVSGAGGCGTGSCGVGAVHGCVVVVALGVENFAKWELHDSDCI